MKPNVLMNCNTGQRMPYEKLLWGRLRDNLFDAKDGDEINNRYIEDDNVSME